ncbi:MAG: DUF4199 domain-containing protein [Candidatus Cyclobacteriaceae bacterium M3_2C_046]
MRSLNIKWGLITAAGLIVYFFAMKMFGLIHILELRYLNAFIMLGGIGLAVRNWKKSREFNYFKGLGAGLAVGFIASLTFAIFSFLYVTVLDPGFMIDIKNNDLLGSYMNPYLVGIQIFIEGTVSAFLFSYAVMQWHKISRFKLSSSQEY